MSVICRHFVQNAWRKDLCSNCFRSEEEHARGAPFSGSSRADVLAGLDELTRRYGRPYAGAGLCDVGGRGGSLTLKSTALLRGLQPRADPAPSPERGMVQRDDSGTGTDTGTGTGGLTSSRLVQLVDSASSEAAPDDDRVDAVDDGLVAGRRGILVRDGAGRAARAARKRSIAFSDQPEVIGYGGDPTDDEHDAPDDGGEEAERQEPADLLTSDERQLWNLTKRNTDFNSISSNLSGTSRTLVDWVDESDRTTERSALTGRHKKFTPMVSIAPFSSARSPGGVKVNLVAPMKNGEVVTERRARREMVEKRGGVCGDAKIAEKITRLDDLIDEKPRKTTSVDINSDRPDSVTENVSVAEFVRSGPDAVNKATSPPLVETRLSFSIGGRRGAPVVSELGSSRSDAAAVSEEGLSPSDAPSSLPMSVWEDRPAAFPPVASSPDGADATSSAKRNNCEDDENPSQRNRMVNEPRSVPSLDRSKPQQPGAPVPSGRNEFEMSNDSLFSQDGRTDDMISVTAPFNRAEPDKSAAATTTASETTHAEVPAKGENTSNKRVTSAELTPQIEDPHCLSNSISQLTNGDGYGAMVAVPADHPMVDNAQSDAAEMARLSARSSALQRLIDEDVDNQSLHTGTSATWNAQPADQKGTALEDKTAGVNSLKSRFSEQHSACKEPVHSRTEIVPTDTPKPSARVNDTISVADTSSSRDADAQPKTCALPRVEFAKPSPRASFLHSLTNSKSDDTDVSFSGFLATTMQAAEPNGRKVQNGYRSVAIENPTIDSVGSADVMKSIPTSHNGIVPKVNASLIRAASKPAGASPKPPILREKPKIAAKPAKLHRLSRTTSDESESSDRATSESHDAERGQHGCRKPHASKKVEQFLIANEEHVRKQDDTVVGTICVEVKSPVLDASTRLTKLVESAKTVPDEPAERSHLTISLSPPRPPARKESLTRKERAMQREKELEKQREELQKRQLEEQNDEPNEKKPAEFRKELKTAPPPPAQKQLERSISSDYEANRAAIANLLSLGHRGNTTKRQAPRAPDAASNQDEAGHSSSQAEAKRNHSVTASSDADKVKRQSHDLDSCAEPGSKDDDRADEKSGGSPSISPVPPTSGVDLDYLASYSQEAGEDKTRNKQTCSVTETKQFSDGDLGAAPEHHVVGTQRSESRLACVIPQNPRLGDFGDNDTKEGHQEGSQSLPEAKDCEAHGKISESKENIHQGEAVCNSETNKDELEPELLEPTDKNPMEEVPANVVGLALPSEPTSEPDDTADQATKPVLSESKPVSRITLKVESAVPVPIQNDRLKQPMETALRHPRELSAADAPMSLPVQNSHSAKFSAKDDDSNPYASSAAFERRSSFRPYPDEDEEDLPPSASMRSSSVSPRSRKRNAAVVSFDPGADLYSRDTVPIKPRSHSMPRAGQLTEGLMTDDEVRRKIYGVSSAGVVATGGGERKSRRDEPKRRGKFSLKKFLKFGSKDDKRKERERGEQRTKPEIIHPLDVTPVDRVEVIVRSEEEKQRDEAERQRKKALLIAEGTRVYDSPSFSKGVSADARLPERSSPTTPSTPTGQASTHAHWQRGSLGFNSEGRPKPPPPPRRTSSIDQSEAPLGQTPPSRPPPPAPEVISRSRDGSDRSTGPRETEYANLGTNRAGLTPRKPDRGGSVRQESTGLQLAAEAGVGDDTVTEAPTAPAPDDSTDVKQKPVQCTSPAAAEQEQQGLPRQRPSRVSLRKQTSVVHANLEENYDAVTANNHEALVQLLDQVSRRRPVPAALQPLEHNPALAFTHFKVSAETHVTCGRRAFLRALHRDQPVLLMLSSELAATPAASLPPVAQFRDLVQGHLLPKASTGSYTSAMQATVWVYPPVTVRPLWELVCSRPAVTSDEQEQEVCLLLLQTVHHLLQLQARGQQFIDQSLCELIATDADGEPQSRLVAVYGNCSERQKLTACQAALAVMLRMLGVEDALERVRDGRGVSVPDVPSLHAFELLASLLLRDDGSSLRRVRGVLEYLLWGPADVELTGAAGSLQRWLDLERAAALNGLVRTRQLWSVELSVLEEFRLMFLVHTDAAALADASALLDI